MTESSTKGLYGAYVKAYMAIENPSLDGFNPHFKNKYATLKATQEAIRTACDANKIIYRQRMCKAGDDLELHSSVMDPTGNEIPISVFPVEKSANSQAFGSALTYSKRQQAQLDWGITGDEDDDAEAAVRPQNPLKDAQQRCWRAIKAYSETHGIDPKAASNGIKKRPDYAETPDFYNKVASEFEGEINE